MCSFACDFSIFIIYVWLQFCCRAAKIIDIPSVVLSSSLFLHIDCFNAVLLHCWFCWSWFRCQWRRKCNHGRLRGRFLFCRGFFKLAKLQQNKPAKNFWYPRTTMPVKIVVTRNGIPYKKVTLPIIIPDFFDDLSPSIALIIKYI